MKNISAVSLLLIVCIVFTSAASFADDVFPKDMLNGIKNLSGNLSALIDKTLSKFKDISNKDWFVGAVSKLTGAGGINGYTDGTFRPGREISRGEFTKILLSAVGYKESENTGKHWASGYVKKAEELNILDKGEFKETDLDKAITRNETAKMINRTLSLLGEAKAENSKDCISLIKDYYSVPQKYREHVSEVYAKGIITGYGDGEFKGDRGLTRAEATAVIVRVADDSERKLPGQEDPNWIEPEFEVFYTTNIKDFYDYFQIRVKNEKEYILDVEKDLYRDYTFSTEIISPKNLKELDFYNILDKKYYDYDVTSRYQNVKINRFPAGTIYALEDLRDCRYSDTKEKVKLKEGQKLVYEVTATNGKTTKKYIIEAEFRNKKFRY